MTVLVVRGEVSPSGQLARAVSQAARHHRHVVHVAQGLGHLDQGLLQERVHTGQCRGAAGALALLVAARRDLREDRSDLLGPVQLGLLHVRRACQGLHRSIRSARWRFYLTTYIHIFSFIFHAFNSALFVVDHQRIEYQRGLLPAHQDLQQLAANCRVAQGQERRAHQTRDIQQTGQGAGSCCRD